ncbi:MAG: hypothetical protein KKH41_03415 [Candidatus Thermoplasmatota archaeon]|nr:hypothetical protein [Euryarchaeota archaeon]MBU4032390.1 hypothetical protein [Candidatus Thermoplasmatota archaeon]MBU4071121.1 hypothetical protein [Candidatus Thermoplasmatota archaeon]MBU4144815.1 hypothetical protein [Candidatus Thermoplasmatota archaeon]MBU4591615.1 hypothetical protein [Candidatus Thermoplasmatota archaeon]
MSGKSRTLAVIVVVIVLIVSSVTVAFFSGNFGNNSPKSGINTSLSISEPPPLNKTTNVTFTFSAEYNLSNDSNLRAEIVFPPIYGDGFEWIDSQPKWRGSLMKGDEIEINGTFKSKKIGNWTIAAIVFWASNDNYSIKWGTTYDGDVHPLLNESININNARYKVMYISVSENTSYISNDPFPEYKQGGGEYPITETSPPYMAIKSITTLKSYNMLEG